MQGFRVFRLGQFRVEGLGFMACDLEGLRLLFQFRVHCQVYYVQG